MREHQTTAKGTDDLEQLVDLANGSGAKARNRELNVSHVPLAFQVIVGTCAAAETLVARTHVEIEHPVWVGHLPKAIHELGLGHVDGRDATQHMGRKERAMDGTDARRGRLEQG